FEQWMLRELRTAFRAAQVVSLLIVDLDGMKTINDTGGHLAGDQALAVVGKCLRDAVRTSDVVGRYGGDEFAIMLPQTPQAGALRVANRILQLVSDKVVDGQSGPLPVKISIGLAVLEPPAVQSPAEAVRPTNQLFFHNVAKALFQRADEALYQSKHDGGGRLSRGGTLQWADVHQPEGNTTTIPPSGSGKAS
ncbi:MAG TPA: GGDEF domain-containing protein, partial [Polyangiaceae bacterium]|nr:GGDEF domain-containing protein [Polyangiaceae bacterium]